MKVTKTGQQRAAESRQRKPWEPSERDLGDSTTNALATNVPLARQLRRDGVELLQCRLQVVSDLLRKDVRSGQVVGIFEARVFEPEDVEVHFVSLQEFFVGEDSPAAFWR